MADAESNEHLAIMQKSTKDPNVPKSIRIDFVKKVYSIVIVMLLVTFGIASPFVFHAKETAAYMKKHIFIFYIALIFLLVQHVFHVCMSMQMCMGDPTLFKKYVKMFKTVPWNFLYLACYSSCFGVVVGVILTAYTATSVIAVFLLCAFIITGLTIWAVYTENDFTDSGGYIVVALLGLIGMSLVGMFLPVGSVFHRVIGGIGAIIFGFIIVYDTQLIFGSATSSEKTFEFTIDMYAFAAFHLYLDFINFFLYMLRLLGERK